MRKILCVFALLTTFVVCGTMALAQQNFPTKPVRLLIPYAAGGAVDILGRTLGDELSKRWGQPVIIENRTGAGGTIASQVVVKSDPDGYTLVIVASGHPINPYLYKKLPYDTFKDFTPISLLGSSPNMMMVASTSPFKKVADVIAAAKAKPGSLSYGQSGIGTSTHLAGELFKYMAKSTSPAFPTRAALRSSTTCSAATSRCRSTTSPNRSARSGPAPCVRSA